MMSVMSTVHSVNPKQAWELLSQRELDVIDVREANEWMSGHLAGARLVPLASFRANPQAALSRKSVLFVCAAGVRSETAARLAVSQGATDVYNLSGGTRAWIRAGLPVEIEPALSATG
jgi:rhodanese-related sulfurtransferase